MSKYTNKVLEDREAQYGDPAVNLGLAADLIQAYCTSGALKRREPCYEAVDVANIMILIKVARLITGSNPGEDTIRDIAGYAELARKLAQPEIKMATATGWAGWPD